MTPVSPSQQHVYGAAATVTAARGTIGYDMPAHAARAEPALHVILKHRMMLMGMPAAPMNHANAGESGAYRLQQELVEDEARLLQVETVQIQVRLN